jgi:hypothetical protein
MKYPAKDIKRARFWAKKVGYTVISKKHGLTLYDSKDMFYVDTSTASVINFCQMMYMKRLRLNFAALAINSVYMVDRMRSFSEFMNPPAKNPAPVPV